MKVVRVAAAIICDCLEDKKSILAVARGSGEFQGWWEFPGGKIEEGETAEQAVVREIKEELSVDIQLGELLSIIEYDYPEFKLIMHCFWAEILGEQNIVLNDAQESKWLNKENLKDLKWLPADIALLDKIEEKLK